ncbi:MAG: MerR family transcriptional regulator [Ktedonobacteraceae bacterium]
MEDRNQKQRITQHLQSAEVQQRILRDMQRAREEATVTISNAASLFDFTENQLRDWEKNGLLNPLRRVQDAEQDGKGPKRRQYTTTELDKLAIIRELIEEAKFSPGAIPNNVDEIWESIQDSNGSKSLLSELEQKENELVQKEERLEQKEAEFVKKELEFAQIETEHLHIDQRVERTEKEEFWHYFVSQALRLSLLLICEDVPDTVAGIILPLEKENVAAIVRTPRDLHLAGYSLVGWLSESRSFFTFLDTGPTFEHPSDFRVESLANLAEDLTTKQEHQNNILVIVQRKAKPLILSKEVVEVVHRLLGFVYENRDDWKPTFENGVRNWMYQATDFTSSSSVSDEVLNDLTDIIVQLGGKMEDGKDRWRFSCITLPEDTSLPVQQRTLVVRAQSLSTPHKLVAVSAKVPGLTFRAYQSGQIIYRPDVSDKDFMIAHQEREAFTRSAIAVPFAGKDGMAIGVVYVASEEMKAFSEEDKQLLRFIGRMIEELFMAYRLRQLPAGRLTDMIMTPEVVDLSFREFASESDFVNEIEDLLKNIQNCGVTPNLAGKELSIIAVDIDNVAGIAAKYGDLVARNLSIAVGLRIRNNPSLLANLKYNGRLYHVNTDTFYILLKGVSLEETREMAGFLKKALVGEYKIDAFQVLSNRTMPNKMLLFLNEVTIRLGVHNYTYDKLKELLERYHNETAVKSLSNVMIDNLDNVLSRGQEMGGNIILSWDYKQWGYIKI